MLTRQYIRCLIGFSFVLSMYINGSAQPGPFTPDMPVDSWDSNWDTDPYIKLGFFPVYLTGAEPNDGMDDTDEINKAIRVARDYRFACYLPAGTYDISDQILAMLPSYYRSNAYRVDRRYSPSIIGDPEHGGVTLKLAPNAPAFSTNLSEPNDTSIVAAVQLWVQPTTGCKSVTRFPPDDLEEGIMMPTDPDQECQGNGFNLHLKNVTIDLNGNANAVGVRAAGAQGCTIENVKVKATGAYAGFQNGFAEGGGMFNIEVEGGQYGLIITDGEQALNFHMAGAVFKNQMDAVFRGNAWSPSTFTGVHIIKESPQLFSSITDSLGSSNLRKARGGPPYTRGLSIIDAVIEIENATATSDEVFRLIAEGNLYLKNVFIKGAINLIGWNGMNNKHTCSDPTFYCHIVEYAHRSHDNTVRNMLMLEGDSSIEDSLKLGSNVEDPFVSNPIEKHIWKNEPWFDPIDQSSEVIVIDPLFGKDMLSDDAHIQQAIDAAGSSGKVFLPRGIYHLDNPLVLGPNTQLFGLDKMTTVLKTGANFPNTCTSYMIETVDDQTASTSLSNIYLEKDAMHRHTSFIHWQAGQHSVLKNVMIGSTNFFDSLPNPEAGRFYHIDGNGGGRWYAVCAEWERLKESTRNDDFRMVYVNNNQSPLSFYGLNTERCYSDVQVEFKDAYDVSVYHYKTEAGGFGSPSNIPVLIKNSDNINMYTVYGLVDKNEVNGITLPIVNLEDNQSACINITNIGSSKSDQSGIFYPVTTSIANQSILDPVQRVGTYKTCAKVNLSCGLIKNYSFHDVLNKYDTISFISNGVSFPVNNGTIEVKIIEGGTQPWHASFSQDGLLIEEAKTYTVQFEMMIDIPRTMRVLVFNNDSGFTRHGVSNIQVNTPNQWLSYEFSFTSPNSNDGNAILQFALGGVDNNTVKIRNICLTEVDCPDNLVLDNFIFDQDNFSANQTISSNSKLSSGGYLEYTAGDEIQLNQAFEVEPASVFIARIEACQ